jgi:hypothetical protein
MVRRVVVSLAVAVAAVLAAQSSRVQAQEMPQAYGQAPAYSWTGTYGSLNMQRFYHYPYVTYPQNYWGSEYYRSADSMYFRYPPEMRIPVYNTGWHNYYPNSRRYHWGHHFILDVF